MTNKTARPSAFLFNLGALLARLLPHLPNFTPVGGAALFGGAKINRPWNYLIPLSVLFITDLILGFHNTMFYVYASFMITVFLGERFLKKDQLVKVGVLAVISSLLFFIITNFGVWIQGWIYPKTFTGLIQCYIMGLPFLRNMLIGDVVFSLGIFSLYRYLSKKAALAKFEQKLVHWLVN